MSVMLHLVRAARGSCTRAGRVADTTSTHTMATATTINSTHTMATATTINSTPSMATATTTTAAATTTTAAATTAPEAVKPFCAMPAATVGDMLRFVNPRNQSKHQEVLAALHKKHGGIFRLRFPGVRHHQIWTDDPHCVKHLLDMDGPMPILPGFDFFVSYRSKMRADLFPKCGGLVGAHGAKWYEVRSKVQQDMMRPKSAMYYVTSIEEISTDLADLIDRTKDSDSDIADVVSVVFPWALESISSIFLDTRLGCLGETPSTDGLALVAASEIVLGRDMFKLLTRPPLWKYLPLPEFRRFSAATESILGIAHRHVARAAAKLREGEGRGQDRPPAGEGKGHSLLAKLLVSSGGDLNIPAVMAVDSMMAGIDTTGTTAAFLLYHLASNREQQETLYQEILRETGDRAVDEAGLGRLKYLRACLQESMRLAPAASGISRRTQVDMTLGGYAVPRKTSVIYFAVNNLLSPKYYPDPEKFLPERWLRSSPPPSPRPPSHLNLPFGHGPRMCIGRRFAEVELQVLLITLLRKYRLENPAGPVGLATSFVNRPDSKMKLKFVSRS